ncbi:MAG TPA: hypothetical protein VFQ51_16415 [Vicinamibacteria bacterium]|nr:hypothetical protein [Vicinamibacteria bacterium]
MTIRRRRKTLAAGTTVALATAGLSSCNHNGAVDPPPPPLECNTLDMGQTLSASATLSGRALQVTIRKSSAGTWGYAVLTSVVGGTAQPVVLGDPLQATIVLTDSSVTEGSFLFSGGLAITGGVCAVGRTFRFAIQAGNVTVASALDLPLPARQQARIALVAREGHDVDLEASTPFGGAHTIAWAVTGGEIVAQDGARLRWRLPPDAGLYQAELVVDYGPWGLSLDTLVLEVG